jgi:hypothetical protein
MYNGIARPRKNKCMKKFALILFACASISASLAKEIPVEVEMRDGQLWAKQADSKEQITHETVPINGFAKSPDLTKYAYNLQADTKENRTNVVKIVDNTGMVLLEIPLSNCDEDSANNPQILTFDFIDKNRLGITFLGNPTTNHYVMFDTKKGTSLGNHLGFNFAWSPNHQKFAYAGWAAHFASDPQKNNYLQINGKNIYPRNTNQEDVGEHRFTSNFGWSPNSSLIAFVDQERKIPNLVICSIKGPTIIRRLPVNVPTVKKLMWTDNSHVQLSGASQQVVFDMHKRDFIK